MGEKLTSTPPQIRQTEYRETTPLMTGRVRSDADEIRIEIGSSQGSHTDAMQPGRVSTSRTHDSTIIQLDDDIDLEAGPFRQDRLHLESQGVLPPSYSTFPSTGELEGSGGCCRAWEPTKELLKAGLVQACSTAATFGVKPFVEAALLQALGVTVLSASTPGLPLLISGLVGGAVVGLMHTAVSTAVSGTLNWALGQPGYDLTPGSNPLKHEFLSVDVPVTGAFVLGYGIRSALIPSTVGIWQDAFSKSMTSTAAGALQGAITNAIKQWFTDVYQSKPPTEAPDGQAMQHLKNLLVGAIKNQGATWEKIGHDFVGKIAGSTVGMAASYSTTLLGTGPGVSGAIGMTAYLTSWFTGIHATAELFKTTCLGSEPVQQPAPQTTTQHTRVTIDPDEMV